MSVDRESANAAYRLGRLLAVLEYVQKRAANWNINATIVDRYYGAASTRPAVVFPRLLGLAQHHLSKLGRKGQWAQDQVGDILSRVNNFPATLSLQEQGLFALGYYHQRQGRKADQSNEPSNGNEKEAAE